MYSKIALSIGSNQNIIVSLTITKIDDSGPIAKSVKSNGGSDCNSAANFQGIKFGTGAVKFKNAVIQCCAIAKCYLLIVVRQIICGIHVEHCNTVVRHDCNGAHYIINHADDRGYITTGDGHRDLLIDTATLVISNSYGISLNQLLTISQGGNSTFIYLKVPVNCFVGGVNGRCEST